LKLIAEKEVEIVKCKKRLASKDGENKGGSREEDIKVQYDSLVEKAYENTYKEYQ